MVDAGRLDTRIEILAPEVTVDSYGTQKTAWPVFIKTCCGIVRGSGRRALVEGEVADLNTREIILRYRKGITAKMRVRFVEDGTLYAIDHPDPKRSQGEIRLFLKTIAENGG